MFVRRRERKRVRTGANSRAAKRNGRAYLPDRTRARARSERRNGERTTTDGSVYFTTCRGPPYERDTFALVVRRPVASPQCSLARRTNDPSPCACSSENLYTHPHVVVVTNERPKTERNPPSRPPRTRIVRTSDRRDNTARVRTGFRRRNNNKRSPVGGFGGGTAVRPCVCARGRPKA